MKETCRVKKVTKKILAFLLTAGMVLSLVGGITLNTNVAMATGEAQTDTNLFVNGGFETNGLTGWTTDKGTCDKIEFSEWAKYSGSYGAAVDCYNSGGTATFTQTVNLDAGAYTLSGFAKDTKSKDNSVQFISDNTALGDAVTINTNDFTRFTGILNVTETGQVSITLKVNGAVGAWVCIDDLTITAGAEVDEHVSGSLAIEKIDGIEETDIRGLDLSSYESIMDSFAAMGSSYGFKDFDGNILTKQEFFTFLKNQGVNWIRLRIWNNPYDSSGNGYGGGNNDLAKAKTMGKLATDAGIRVLIDFHYSDFWADPGKQAAPKAWADKSIDEKAALIKSYTKTSLEELINAGVDVGMVQVGNETNGAMCGVEGKEDWTDNLDKLFDAGCDAVHEVTGKSGSKDILAAVHFTDPQTVGKQEGYAANLAAYDSDGNGTREGVSYDVFATSYYPYWHGSLTRLSTVLGSIAKTYGKKVMVAETSYANTLDDVDGHENTVRIGNNDTGDDLLWSFTEYGQACEFRDVLDTVLGITDDSGNKAGIGVFYWEGTWIGLADAYDTDGNIIDSVYDRNKTYWEKYGSGWAASYGGSYEPEDAGKWYGGSAVENQCFFGRDGKALDSISVFSYENLSKGVKVASDAVKIIGYDINTITKYTNTTLDASDLSLTLVDNTGKETTSTDVTWSTSDINNVNKALTSSEPGTYKVTGKTSSGMRVACLVNVEQTSILQNFDFEQGDKNWVAGENNYSSAGIKNNENNSRSGSYYTHAWADAKSDGFEYKYSQEITITESGLYSAFAYLHGTPGKGTVNLYVDGVLKGTSTEEATGWKSFKTPRVDNIEVTAGQVIKVEIVAIGEPTADTGSYICFDDVMLYKTGEISDTSSGGSVSGAPSSNDSSSSSVNGNTSVPADNTASTEDPSVSPDEQIPPSETAVAPLITETTDKDGNKVTTTVTETETGKEIIEAVSDPVTGETLKTVVTTIETSKTGTASINIETTEGKSEKKETYTVNKDGKTVTLNKSVGSGVSGNVKLSNTITVDGEKYKVTKIDASAFENNKKIKSITIGNNIKTIGKKAFKGNTTLTKVTMGTAVQSINTSAFNGDTSLKKIVIKGNTLTKVAKNAFKGISKTAVITINAGKKAYKRIKSLIKESGINKNVKIKHI